MTIHIRTISPDETSAWIEAVNTAFFDRVDPDRVAEELRSLWDFDRVWAAFEGTTTVGTFRTWATELTVPGGARLPGAAVTGVTVRPSHRRRGILTDMAAAGHAGARASGEAVGILYAAEYAIYGRFGYGPAAREATLTVDASAPGFHHPARGTVELVRASAEVAQVIKGVFETWRARQVAELARKDYRWDFELGLRESVWGPRWNGFVALHRDEAGTVDGYVRYKAEEKWAQRQPRAVVTIDELHAVTGDAYEALWQFLMRMDLVTVIKAERRHPAERLPWLLTNARSVEIADVGDGLWLALLDVPRALAARTYAREGALVLEVIEGAGTPTETRSRLQLKAGPDGATCKRTDRSADLTLDVSALSAAYLGGARLRDTVLARGCDEHRTGALAEADAMFATIDQPWCSTFF